MKKEYIINKFRKEQSGNIALTTALLLIPIMLSIGATIDYSRGARANSLIQQSADAAVLATLDVLEKGETPSNARKAGRRAFRFNLPDDPKYKTFIPNFNINTQTSQTTVTATVKDSIPNIFLPIAGIDTFPINVTARSFIATPRQEISLVLDVSQSMLQNNRLTNMISAVKDFIAVLPPFVKGPGFRVINLVPFSNRVNLGSSYSHWADPTITAVPFDGCFEIDKNHSNLMDNIPSKPPGKMLPYRNTVAPSGNPRCAGQDSRISLFETNMSSITSKIDSLSVGFGTGTDVAIQWGWRTLSPKWRTHYNGPQNFPRDYDFRNEKILILLTDGRIFRQEIDAPYPNKGKQIQDKKADDTFNQICNDIDDNTNIRVFTIGFDLNTASSNLRNALQNCASNGGNYFDASTTNISDTFKTIADQIQSLRLVR